jgi:cytochrome b561
MALFYLGLALVLAIALNMSQRLFRVLGTLACAAGLWMMIWSIHLANGDGTFAKIPASAPLSDRVTPLVLNVQAGIALITIVFLIWAAWMQAVRKVDTPLPLTNQPNVYGRISRTLHWFTAVAMFCLVPIGLFMAFLPTDFPGRGDFYSAHQSLGLTVMGVALVRLVWLIISPAPPLEHASEFEARAAHWAHIGLYAMLFAFPVSGYVLNVSLREPIDFYGYAVPILFQTSPALSNVATMVHNWILPLIFYAVAAAHIGAVAKRHFQDRDKEAVRRMLR